MLFGLERALRLEANQQPSVAKIALKVSNFENFSLGETITEKACLLWLATGCYSLFSLRDREVI
jgi:hypothetical protein